MGCSWFATELKFMLIDLPRGCEILRCLSKRHFLFPALIRGDINETEQATRETSFWSCFLLSMIHIQHHLSESEASHCSLWCSLSSAGLTSRAGFTRGVPWEKQHFTSFYPLNFLQQLSNWFESAALPRSSLPNMLCSSCPIRFWSVMIAQPLS